MQLSLTDPLNRHAVTVAVAMCAFVSLAYSQSASGPELGSQSPEVIDEIIVSREKPIVLLRHEMRMAEKQVFDMFNALNTDDEFDVECGRETRRDLVSWDWACRPNYEKDLRTEEGRRMLIGGSYINAEARIRTKHEELKKKMEALMREQPEFLQSLLKLADATEALELEREKRCKGRIICRRPGYDSE